MFIFAIFVVQVKSGWAYVTTIITELIHGIYGCFYSDQEFRSNIFKVPSAFTIYTQFGFSIILTIILAMFSCILPCLTRLLKNLRCSFPLGG